MKDETMDDATGNLLLGIYQHLRFIHLRVTALNNAVDGLIGAEMDDSPQSFREKYTTAYQAAQKSDRAKQDDLGLKVIDAVISQLSGNPLVGDS